MKRTDAEKMKLVKKWSRWFYDHTETFGGALGRQLAYLFPAIINDHQIEVSRRSSIVKTLKRGEVPETDDIWDYIDVVG